MREGWTVVEAKADDPIYQQGIIGVGITRPKDLPTESKTLDEDYKNDPDWMEDKKRFKTPSKKMQETMEEFSKLV